MRKTLLTLLVFVFSAFFVFAQVPQNVETATRYRGNINKKVLKQAVSNRVISKIDEIQTGIYDKKSNAQLEDLGSRYGWLRSDAQLEDLGSRYGWLR